MNTTQFWIGFLTLGCLFLTILLICSLYLILFAFTPPGFCQKCCCHSPKITPTPKKVSLPVIIEEPYEECDNNDEEDEEIPLKREKRYVQVRVYPEDPMESSRTRMGSRLAVRKAKRGFASALGPNPLEFSLDAFGS